MLAQAPSQGTNFSPTPAVPPTPDLVCPLPPGKGFCAVIPDFLSPEECQHFIALSEGRGFASAASAYPPSYRNNDRFVLDDAELALGLLARLRRLAPDAIRDSEVSAEKNWVLEAINEKFRFCRYRAGQAFQIHQDGAHHRDHGVVSRVTFLVYLSGEAAFSGGDTVFYAGGPAMADAAGSLPPEMARIKPQAGSLILFDHTLWHAGEAVSAGCKHIMRSDLIYRDGHWQEPARPRTLDRAHDGYVWTLAALADGRVASGGRDATIRLWHADGSLSDELRGHQQSVLGLASFGNGRLASVSRDHSLRLWNTEGSAAPLVVNAHDAAALCISALPDQKLATGGADHCVKIWSDDGAALQTLRGHNGWVWAVQPVDAQLLASASEDGDVRLWHMQSGACVQRLLGATPLRAVTAWGLGRILVTGDNTGMISIWLDSTGQARKVASFQGHAGAVRCLRLLDARTLVSGGEDYCTRVWHWPGQELQAEFASANFVTDVLLRGNELLISSYDGQITRQTI